MAEYEDESRYIRWRTAMRDAERTARKTANPDVARRVRVLMRDFPWLQPGTAVGLAQMQARNPNLDNGLVVKTALADLEYQAQNTDRFGPRQKFDSPQERLQAWDKELREYLREDIRVTDPERYRQLRETYGTDYANRYGDPNSSEASLKRASRFGEMPVKDLRKMRRTVRAALATNDPLAMNAVLGSLGERSRLPVDPYTASNPVELAKVDSDSVLNAVSRTTALALDAPFQVTAGAVRGVVGFGKNVIEDTGIGPTLRGERAPGIRERVALGVQSRGKGQALVSPETNASLMPKALLEQSQAGQAALALIRGEPVDTGSGPLPDPTSATAQAQGEAARKYSPYLINGHAWTLGRAVGGAFGEPDSAAFTVASGLIDAAFMMIADPANKGLAILGEANRAAKTFDAVGNVVGDVRNIERELSLVDEAARAGDNLVDAYRVRDVPFTGGERVWSTREGAQKVVDSMNYSEVERIRVPRDYFNAPTDAERAAGVVWNSADEGAGLGIEVRGRPIPSSPNNIVELRPAADSALTKAWMTEDGTLYESAENAPNTARPVTVDKDVFGRAEGETGARVIKVDPRRVQSAQGPTNIPPAGEGLPTLTHGTLDPLDGQPDVAFAKEKSVYGPAFYTSDSPNFTIADEYARLSSGANPENTVNSRVYWVEWIGEEPPRVLDLEGPIPDGLVERSQEWLRQNLPGRQSSLGEDTATASSRTAGEYIQSVFREIELEATARYGGLTLPEKLAWRRETLLKFRNEVLGESYDVMRYDGGVRSGLGAELHNAYAWINEKNLRANRVVRGNEFVEREAARGIVRDGEVITKADVLRKAGVHTGRRAWLRAKNPVDWLYGAGSDVVKAIAAEDSPWRLYWALGGKIPVESPTGQRLLKALADATTESEVRVILSRELGTTIDRIPAWRGGANAPMRLTRDMPKGLLQFDDHNQVVHELVDYMGLAKFSPARQEEVFNQAVNILGTGDNYALVDLVFDLTREQMVKAGAPADLIDDLLKRARADWDGASKFGVYAESGEDMPLQLVLEQNQANREAGLFSVPDEIIEIFGPRYVGERLRSSVPLPDPVSVRRWVSSPAFKKMVTFRDAADKNLLSWGTAMSGIDYLNDLWKFTTLVRLAWPARVLFDEMLRIAATGSGPFDLGPLSYIALAIGHHPTESKVIAGIEKIFNAFDKPPTKLEVLAALESGEDIPRSVGQQIAAKIRSGRFKMAKYRADGSGAPWDLNDIYGEALAGRLWGNRTPGSRAHYLNYFDEVPRDSEYWSRGLVEELHRMHESAFWRHAVGDDPDTFLEELWSSSWGRYNRSQMAAGSADDDVWRLILSDRDYSDAYGRAMLKHLEDFTGGDQDLLDAIRWGRFGEGDDAIWLSRGGHSNPDAHEVAAYLRDTERGPAHVKVRRSVREPGNAKQGYRERLSEAPSVLFDALGTKPSNWLSRSPVFRYHYWEQMERVLPRMTRDAQDQVIRSMGSANIPQELQSRLRAVVESGGSGELKFSQADEILKKRGLDYTRGLLYDLHKKSQFMDAARLVLPFGEAWKEIVTTWARIFKEYPQNFRRLEQGITAARTSVFNPVTGLPTGEGDSDAAGFFHPDPQTGLEVFTFPLSGQLAQLWGGTPTAVPMKGSVSSMNLLLQGMPGIGPVGQIPLSILMRNKSGMVWDKVRDVVFPYGTPEQNGVIDEALNILMPAWIRRFNNTTKDPKFDRLVGNAVVDLMAVYASTGDYKFGRRAREAGVDANDEILRLYHDAEEANKKLGWLRTLGAFVLPASPMFDIYVQKKMDNPDLVLLQTVKDKFYAMREQGLSSDEAFKKFLTTYGVDNVFAIQPKSRNMVVGLSSNVEQRKWENQNKDIVEAYPKTWALFAPEGKTYDYAVYKAHIDEGYAKSYQPLEGAKESMQRLGWAEYNTIRKTYPAVPTRQQSVELAAIADRIAQDHPGWTRSFSGNEDLATEIQELERASQDPKTERTSLGKALRAYFAARAQANADAVAGTKRSVSALSSKETQRYRDWLRDEADDIAARWPAFERAWEQVLSRELNEDG